MSVAQQHQSAPAAPSRDLRALLFAAEAASLAIMSSLHLSGVLGESKPFDPSAAGIAEALICVALASAALVICRAPDRARPYALGAVGFAIAGFVVGLNFTARGGSRADLAYHATMLPILLFTMVLMIKSH